MKFNKQVINLIVDRENMIDTKPAEQRFSKIHQDTANKIQNVSANIALSVFPTNEQVTHAVKQKLPGAELLLCGCRHSTYQRTES